MSDIARPGTAPAGATPVSEQTIELLEERIAVERRQVAGQTVRVATETRVREQLVEEPLVRETVEVDRVAIGRVVEAAPAVREEGDFIIVPVMEEVLVVERRLVLKEEVRLRRVRTTEVHRETVQLREQAATVSRIEADGTPVGLAQTSPSPAPERDTP